MSPFGEDYVAPALTRLGTTVRIGENTVPAIVRKLPKEFLQGRVVSVAGQKLELEIETGSLPGLEIGSVIIVGTNAVILEGAVIPTTVWVASAVHRFGDGQQTRVECSRA